MQRSRSPFGRSSGLKLSGTPEAQCKQHEQNGKGKRPKTR